jgi:hypothetical protein
MTPDEPEPPDPSFPRLAPGPLPLYRYVPGRSPHPRRDPRGHSYGRPEPKASAVDPSRWRDHRTYLAGIDLYNLGYFWECHEAFEALWRAAGSETTQSRFFQGLIQIAASNLKLFLGAERASQALAEKALAKLALVPPAFMGLDVDALRHAIEARLRGERREAPALRLLERT